MFQQHLHSFIHPGAAGARWSLLPADGLEVSLFCVSASVGKRWPLQKCTCCWTESKLHPLSGVQKGKIILKRLWVCCFSGKKNTPVSFHSANFCCYAIILFANAQKSKSDSTSRKQQAWRRLSFLFSCLLLVLFVSWHKSARDWLFE